MPLQMLEYGQTRIEYSISRSERKTLAIEVHPDMRVMIVAPVDATLETIKERVSKRASWIIRQRQYFQTFLPRIPEREYISGESHYYLGRRYMLKIVPDEKRRVKLRGGRLMIHVPKNELKNKEKIRNLLGAWYREKGEARFQERFRECLKRFEYYRIKQPALKIKRMKARWGSCTPGGKIILNPELIKAPVKCIDYVIIHELCHLIHPSHNASFYEFQTKINPEWKRWRELLNKLWT